MPKAYHREATDASLRSQGEDVGEGTHEIGLVRFPGTEGGILAANAPILTTAVESDFQKSLFKAQGKADPKQGHAAAQCSSQGAVCCRSTRGYGHLTGRPSNVCTNYAAAPGSDWRHGLRLWDAPQKGELGRSSAGSHAGSLRALVSIFDPSSKPNSTKTKRLFLVSTSLIISCCLLYTLYYNLKLVVIWSL